MVERLTRLDASFLYLEEPDTPMHVGGVLILEAPAGGLDALASLVEARLALVPRYRQRVAEVPGHLANPVWVDDPDFDIAYHVRRNALPRPGTEAQLLDLVSRLASRPLDRRRPLWEMYLVEGLSEGRVVVVTKTHPALVDGLSAIDIGQVLLDVEPHAAVPEAGEWRPQRPPNGAQLVWEALDEYARRPSAIVDTARGAVTDVRSTAARVTGVAGGLLRTVRKTLLPAPHSPLNAPVGRQRRVAVARVDLDDVKRIRKAHGGTVNDVLLTVVTGALRDWLLSRGEPVVAATSVRALVPVSMQDEDAVAGNRVSSYLVDLPVGEANPRVRLARLSYAMRGYRPARAVRRRGQPDRPDRVRPADPARAGRAGGARVVPTVVQPRGDQRARPAVPAVCGGQPDARGVPGRAAGPWSRTVHRDDQLQRAGVLRVERRPRQRGGRRRPGRPHRAGGR